MHPLSDPRSIDRQVRLRTWKRRLTAAVSIALAAAAGTFLAAAKSKGAADAGTRHRPDAGSSRDGGIDRAEHRNGMPVRDNLLE